MPNPLEPEVDTMIRHWHWYTLPDATRVLACRSYGSDATYSWIFRGIDGTPLFKESCSASKTLLQLTPMPNDSEVYVLSLSDITLEDLVPTGEFEEGWDISCL